MKHPGVVGEKTPALLIVPPPLTVHVPPVAPPDCENVTAPPPIHELTVDTTGNGFTVIVAEPVAELEHFASLTDTRL